MEPTTDTGTVGILTDEELEMEFVELEEELNKTDATDTQEEVVVPDVKEYSLEDYDDSTPRDTNVKYEFVKDLQDGNYEAMLMHLELREWQSEKNYRANVLVKDGSNRVLSVVYPRTKDFMMERLAVALKTLMPDQKPSTIAPKQVGERTMEKVACHINVYHNKAGYPVVTFKK